MVFSSAAPTNNKSEFKRQNNRQQLWFFGRCQVPEEDRLPQVTEICYPIFFSWQSHKFSNSYVIYFELCCDHSPCFLLFLSCPWKGMRQASIAIKVSTEKRRCPLTHGDVVFTTDKRLDVVMITLHGFYLGRKSIFKTFSFKGSYFFHHSTFILLTGKHSISLKNVLA